MNLFIHLNACIIFMSALHAPDHMFLYVVIMISPTEYRLLYTVTTAMPTPQFLSCMRPY